MRALIQRVSQASVTVDGQRISEIGQGVLILLGIGQGDGEAQLKKICEKIVHLRIFEDEEGKMHRSLLDINGQALVVSQFTLYADARKGRRPSFINAASPALAEPLVQRFQEMIASYGIPVAGGIFGADMKVGLINDGPVTIWLDSDQL